MYNRCETDVMNFIHEQGRGKPGQWFTAGDCARAKKMSIGAARKWLRYHAARWDNLIDVHWLEYRSNVQVQVFRVGEIK